MTDLADRLKIIDLSEGEGTGSKKKRTVRVSECTKCGSCCTAASPMLMKEDYRLFLSESLNHTNTRTIRAGEPLYNRQEQEVFFTPFEVIKVEDEGGCIFYSGVNGCSIYEERPIQCRSYECWNQDPPLEGLEDSRLTREELFGTVEHICEIIKRHEELCSYERLAELIEGIQKGVERDIEEILEMLSFDMTAREFVSERFGITGKGLNLLFGSPMTETIRLFGLEVTNGEDGFTLSLISDEDKQT